MDSTDALNPSPMSPGKAPTLARAATLAHIAEHVGVSKVAVSVVLNNSRSQVRVSAATRQRIIDAARELNYQPNVLARSLLRRHTNVIGFYSAQRQMFDPLYPFYGSVLKGLLKGCEEHKKNFLVHGTFNNVSEDDIYLELLNGQIDGLVLYAREATPLIKRLVASHLPVVTVADEVPGLPCVTVDSRLGGQLLARHLAQKGYKRVLYWVAHEELPSTIQLRLDGFQEEAAAHDIEVEVFHPEGAWPFEDDLKQLMARKNRPEVIAAFSDFTANQIISWCKATGIRVPQDIAVTGFDGFVGTFGSPTGITTIRAPWHLVAETAVSLLVQQCSGEAIAMRTQLAVELIDGETA